MGTQTFEESLADLQDVLRKLEDGETGLEDALTCYENGISLLRRCYGQLREAEQRILLLTGEENGQPVTEPFVHLATTDERDGTPRRRKKSGPPEIPF